MKKLIALLVALCLLFCPLPAFANGDPNIDGGGGDMEDGDVSGGSFWTEGNDGVRVTIIDESRTAIRPVKTLDFSNQQLTMNFYFGLTSKLNYKSGNLQIQVGTNYTAVTPDNPIPPIISSSGGTNIAAVKEYFATEGTIRDIASKTGFEYDQLISGDYVLLLEPVIYLTFNGVQYAMTATEAALFNRVRDNELKSKLGYATHQNLPLAMFLETPDLGYPAWSGATSGVRSDSEIISALGIGTVRFRDGACCGHPSDCPCITNPWRPNDCTCKEVHPDLPCGSDTPGCDCTTDGDTPGGGGSPASYQYRTDTDVITSVTISNNSSDDIDPDDNAQVTFSVNGTNYHKDFVIPPDEDTLMWVEWHTPATPQQVIIHVSSTHASVSASTITCDVGTLLENTPPDPQPTDQPPYGYSVPNSPVSEGRTSLTWGEWVPRWHENWVWVPDSEWVDGSHDASCSEDCDLSHGEWEDNGQYEDEGWWEYDWRSYSASLRVTTKVAAAAEAPTAMQLATGRWQIKSGYGVVANVQATVSSNSSDVTNAQNAVSFFPEFDYSEYFRVLTRSTSGNSSSFAYAYNKYSFMGASVHYTPLWFPDNSNYAPKFQVFDAWTPAGQLYYTSSDYLKIDGDCYDDWNVSPYRD